MGVRKKKKGKAYKASDQQTYQVTEMVSVDVNRVGEVTGTYDATPKKNASLGEITVYANKRKAAGSKARRQEHRATKKASRQRKKESRKASKKKKIPYTVGF